MYAIRSYYAYTITLSNAGGTDAMFDLTDTLGTGLTYVTSSPLGSNAGATTTWTGLVVPAGGSLRNNFV